MSLKNHVFLRQYLLQRIKNSGTFEVLQESSIRNFIVYCKNEKNTISIQSIKARGTELHSDLIHLMTLGYCNFLFMEKTFEKIHLNEF
jgi:hypothetical protein